MHRGLWSLLLLLGGIGPGCSGPGRGAESVAHLGPHQGTLVKLPEGLGYAEVLNAGPDKGRSAGRQQGQTQLIVYFLAPELQAPAAVAASNVVARLSVATGRPPETVALEPAPESGDPLGAKRFVSKTGNYHLSSAHAELSATIDGRPFAAEFDAVR
jgi:hypothetical protein